MCRTRFAPAPGGARSFIYRMTHRGEGVCPKTPRLGFGFVMQTANGEPAVGTGTVFASIPPKLPHRRYRMTPFPRVHGGMSRLKSRPEETAVGRWRVKRRNDGRPRHPATRPRVIIRKIWTRQNVSVFAIDESAFSKFMLHPSDRKKNSRPTRFLADR